MPATPPVGRGFSIFVSKVADSTLLTPARLAMVATPPAPTPLVTPPVADGTAVGTRPRGSDERTLPAGSSMDVQPMLVNQRASNRDSDSSIAVKAMAGS